MKPIIKDLFKLVSGWATSPEFVRMFDADGNGVVSWSEFWYAPRDKKMKALSIVVGDLIVKYGLLIFALL